MGLTGLDWEFLGWEDLELIEVLLALIWFMIDGFGGMEKVGG